MKALTFMYALIKIKGCTLKDIGVCLGKASMMYGQALKGKNPAVPPDTKSTFRSYQGLMASLHRESQEGACPVSDPLSAPCNHTLASASLSLHPCISF